MTTNGVHAFTREQYDALPDRTNFSVLKHMARSPKAYLWALLNPSSGDSDVMLRGRAVHTRVYEPELFRSAYAVWEDRRAGKFWEAFEAKAHAAGQEVLTAKLHQEVIELAEAIRRDPMAAPYLTGGKREQSLLFDQVRPQMGGLEGYTRPCKARLDYVRPDCIVDLKTTRNAEPRAFGAQANALLYYAQAAFYVDGLALATGTPRRPYVIIAVEAAPPYVVQVYRVPEHLIEMGRAKYWELLDRLDLCRREDSWPGYAAAPLDLELPPWVMGTDDIEEEAA